MPESWKQLLLGYLSSLSWWDWLAMVGLPSFVILAFLIIAWRGLRNGTLRPGNSIDAIFLVLGLLSMPLAMIVKAYFKWGPFVSLMAVYLTYYVTWYALRAFFRYMAARAEKKNRPKVLPRRQAPRLPRPKPKP